MSSKSDKLYPIAHNSHLFYGKNDSNEESVMVLLFS